MPPPHSLEENSFYVHPLGDPINVDRTFDVVEENEENNISSEDNAFLKDLAEEIQNEEEIAIKSANLLKILQVS